MAGHKLTDGVDLTGVRWLEFADPDAERAIGHLPSSLDCRVLRYTPRRRVSHVTSHPALLVKQYFQRGPFEFAKTLLRGAPAQREWRALREATLRRLPVPTALALGWRDHGLDREGILVTEFIESSVDLEDYLRHDLTVAEKFSAVRQAGLLIRQMHDAGFYQRDLHLGNLLVRERDREVALLLVDLQRIEIDPRSAAVKRWRDLAMLHGGIIGLSRSQRLRFLDCYLSAAPSLGADKRRLTATLDRRGLRHRLKIWRSRRRRCLAENRDFARIEGGGFCGFWRAAEQGEAVKTLLANPAGLLAHAELIKNSRTTTVGRIDLAGQKLFAKRYNYQGLAYALKDLFRSSRAKRGWIAANDCVTRGIGAALPLAYMERRRARVLTESYLLTAAVPGEELGRWLVRRAHALGCKRALLRSLASMLRQMHDRGVAPRDLKADNFIIRKLENGRFEFSVVDFDGIARGPVSRRARAKNLARLVRAVAAETAISRTDRWRMATSYHGQVSREERRGLFRRVVNRR